MKTYVLHEMWPLDDGAEDILGVYSTPEGALEKMRDYYGDYTLLEDHNQDFDDIHFRKKILAKDPIGDDMILVVTLLIFQLDE